MNNQKIYLKIIMLTILSFCILGITGCKSLNEITNQSDSEVNFKKMSEEEKKEYVLDYLRSKYNLNNANILTLNKRQLDIYTLEENYFASIEVEPNNQFNMWISDDGKVYDTYFTLLLRDKINNKLQEIYQKEFPNCKVYDNFRFCDVSSKEWNVNDNLDDMLNEEDLVHTILLFIPKEDKKDDDLLRLESLKDELDIYDGNTNLYYVGNIEEADYTKIDPFNYDLQILN